MMEDRESVFYWLGQYGECSPEKSTEHPPYPVYQIVNTFEMAQLKGLIQLVMDGQDHPTLPACRSNTHLPAKGGQKGWFLASIYGLT